MTAIFDTHVIVDWSARSKPSPKRPSKDAIWFAVVRHGTPSEPIYCRTRDEALTMLADFLAEEVVQNRRVLIGFDFPFGYPAGVARRICGSDCALDLWAWFADMVMDGPDNQSNRFDVAGQINRLYDGIGPFWGRPETWDIPDVPPRASTRCGADHPPEHRLADARAKRAKTVWQLAYAGSVGSQVILGLPALQRLRCDLRLAGRIAVWPFQTGLKCPDAQVVMAEIYPSLLQAQAHAARRESEVLDSAQVRVNAKAFSRLDRSGGLASLFAATDGLTAVERRTVEREEAWILGLGHETALQNAALEAA
jgi:precorrin-8X/cobalt-precorrin-8 methylmutase